MTFAPALTWMQLLPADASYKCAAAPEWFGELLQPHAQVGGKNIPIAFEENLNGWAERHRGASSLVAINCRGLDRVQLAAAGFDYVRGFAAIPSLAAARWFIPLDSGSVSSAGFKLYSPTRLSARLKRAAVRALARTGMPLWFRDQIWIAQRERPPLEQMIAKCVGRSDIRLALSSGAAEPACNRKASAAVLGTDGTIYGFVKISGSPLARRLLEHEAAFLSVLGSKADVRDSVPHLLGCGSIDDRFVLVQSPVPGGPASSQLTSAHRRFLSTLESTQQKPATATAMVAGLTARQGALGTRADFLASSLVQVLASLVDCAVPSTIVHGDFAPWNIRQQNGMLCCYDWEYGRSDGVPLIDETHHELQVGYELHHWTIEQADQKLNDFAAAQTRFKRSHAAALQNVYLIDALLRLTEEGYDDSNAMVNWTRRLLERRVALAAVSGVIA